MTESPLQLASLITTLKWSAVHPKIGITDGNGGQTGKIFPPTRVALAAPVQHFRTNIGEGVLIALIKPTTLIKTLLLTR